jgi:short-subunit dehydrogenase
MNVVITGASSGLGAALAREYAAAGVQLGLLGRSEARLAETRAACEAKGATVRTASIDVASRESMESWLVAFDKEHPIDLLIANAGISSGTGGDDEPYLTYRLFATNVDGVLHTILPVAPRMVERRGGQIALISSLAGIRGLPSAPAYSASKNAVRAYGEALRGRLGKDGVRVSVVCPGYIKTPLTDKNDFPMPFIMEAEKAARIIRRGLRRNRSRIAFPWMLYVPLWLMASLSTALTDWLFARLPEKK